MKKLLFICAAAAMTAVVFAQGGHEPSEAVRRYHAQRILQTEPVYGLAKVKSLIAKIKADSEGNQSMPLKEYGKLSLAERFTYAMLHGENFSQNCDAMPAILDESQKIYSYPPSPFGDEEVWSERQRTFLNQNRSKVLSMVRSTINARHRAGPNLLGTILELHGFELVPDLVTLFKSRRQDLDILSTLMVLMKIGQYKPFLASTSYTKLYGDKASYQAFLVANTANQNLIVDRALSFYNSRKKA